MGGSEQADETVEDPFLLRRLTRTSLASERPQQTGPCGAGFMPNALLSTSASTPSANLGTRPDMADGALLRPSRARLMANEAGRAASSGPSASDGPTRHEIFEADERSRE